MKKAFVQLHIAILLAGFTGVLGRLISINEGLLVWYRLFFTAITLGIMALITKKVSLRFHKSFFSLIGIGFIIALHWVFFYGSIKYSNVSVGLVCFSSIGFFSSVVEPLILNRRVDPVEVVLGIAVMFGVYLIFHFANNYQLGIVFGLISSFLAALFTILNKSMVGKHNPETISFYELGGGWIALTFFLPFYFQFFPVERYFPTSLDLVWLMVLSLFCTVLAFNLSIRSLQKISPFTVNLSYNLEPVYGIALAFLIYQEHRELGSSFYFGIGIIFLTVLIQTLRTWRKRV
jgi:drug/metabolite transporter (DMT)-like permease